MSEKLPAKLFDPAQAQALAMASDAAAVARATQEIQAALVIARSNPRDEIKIKAKILQACQRQELAESAEYEYSRGGTRITGPTIDLLRAIANRWGNIRYGWTEVDRRLGPDGTGASSIRCFAWDMQTNGQAERTFTVRHWRDTQAGGYPLEDERDIYEMLANQAARRVRACLEEVIDSDIVDAAIDACRRTMRAGAKEPLADRAVQVVNAFQEFGVTIGMIEDKLGNNMEAISENQIASLRRIFKALKDGVGKREDYFRTAVEASKPATVTPPPPETPPASKPEATAPGAPAAHIAPPAGPPAAPLTAGGFNPLKATRNLCKMAGVPEGKLLEFLDAGVGTLEEVDPGTLKAAADNWQEIVSRLKGELL